MEMKVGVCRQDTPESRRSGIGGHSYILVTSGSSVHQAPALSSGPFIGLNKPGLPIHHAGAVARECEISG